MKRALEARGTGSNLFHQDAAARETDDSDVVAATMSKPGVVLRRAAGWSGRFAEHSDLPTRDETDGGRKRSLTKARKRSPAKISEKSAGKAALDFEKERKRHEAERRREASQETRAARQGGGEAQAALNKAERDHNARTAAIETERAVFEKRTRMKRLVGETGEACSRLPCAARAANSGRLS
jgi:colicin import membrane protein